MLNGEADLQRLGNNAQAQCLFCHIAILEKDMLGLSGAQRADPQTRQPKRWDLFILWRPRKLHRININIFFSYNIILQNITERQNNLSVAAVKGCALPLNCDCSITAQQP